MTTSKHREKAVHCIRNRIQRTAIVGSREKTKIQAAERQSRGLSRAIVDMERDVPEYR